MKRGEKEDGHASDGDRGRIQGVAAPDGTEKGEQDEIRLETLEPQGWQKWFDILSTLAIIILVIIALYQHQYCTITYTPVYKNMSIDVSKIAGAMG